MGFADVSYLATERDMPDGFLLGQLVGHMNAGLTDRLSVFSEFSATARATGYTLEAERLIIRYDFADAFKLSAGRYHTPISYWNVAFHHGAWLQTSVARPEVVRFGSLMIPVHFVGILAEGNLPTGPLGLGYAAGIGNGRAGNIARAGDAGNVNGHTAWTANLSLRPRTLFGFQVGGGVYSDRATPDGGVAVDERILAAHVAWTRERPEVIAEFTRFQHERADGTAPRVDTDAYYAQVAYRLPGAASAWKPYVRVERNDVPAQGPLFGPLNLDYEAAIAGLRFDFAPLAALKAEYRRERFAAPERFHSLYLQASFAVTGLMGGGRPLH
jgi:hypothetical protein